MKTGTSTSITTPGGGGGGRRTRPRWRSAGTRALSACAPATSSPQRQPVILLRQPPRLRADQRPSTGDIGEGTGGVTEILKRRVVLPDGRDRSAETDHVLGHELVHAFQFDMTGEAAPSASGNVPAAVRLPLWFIEGMAEYLSLGPVDPHTAMWMRDAVGGADRMPPRSDRPRQPRVLPLPLRARPSGPTWPGAGATRSGRVP